MREIVSRYDIDGIHLDYIRYPERASDFPDQSTYRKYGKKESLQQWRRNNINPHCAAYLYRNKIAKALGKGKQFSCWKIQRYQTLSSRGWNAYEVVYQDALQWLKNGIHDAFIPDDVFSGKSFLSVCPRLAGK